MLYNHVAYKIRILINLQVKKGYVGIHSSGFKDFLLKPELLRAIQDCGFEHPSEGKLNHLAACHNTSFNPANTRLPP